MSAVLRVAVCSPQEIVAAGLASLIGRHPDKFCVVPLLAESGQAGPDVVLFDSMGLRDGPGAALTELVEHGDATVLAVSRDLRPDLASRALALGADGYFSLSVDEDALVAALESVGAGWETAATGADPTVRAGAAGARASRLGSDVGLNDREITVLELLGQGRSNQEMADQLFLSINTVKTHVRTAYRKIGVTRRSQAVTWAIRNGLDVDPRQDAGT